MVPGSQSSSSRHAPTGKEAPSEAASSPPSASSAALAASTADEVLVVSPAEVSVVFEQLAHAMEINVTNRGMVGRLNMLCSGWWCPGKKRSSGQGAVESNVTRRPGPGASVQSTRRGSPSHSAHPGPLLQSAGGGTLRAQRPPRVSRRQLNRTMHCTAAQWTRARHMAVARLSGRLVPVLRCWFSQRRTCGRIEVFRITGRS
jgi:hypothetical protein